jgi:anaerobic selenocysteine-containing dehydrogenase
MSKNVSRRDFLKLATAGAATTAVLTGCGPASRYIKREPYTEMPEYTYNGLSTYYATTCRECAAGCGLIVRTMQGRAIKVEGNANHPVNLGKTCPRGQTTLQGLYNPDRITGPISQGRNESLTTESLAWEEALQVVADALNNNNPSEIAFLMGTWPDHLFDLVTDLSTAIGAPAPMRYGVSSMFEARATLTQAAENLFGQAALPFFDIGNAEVVISFGANFLETWLSPVAYNRAFAQLRRGNPDRRGRFIQFESRLSQTASKADEWIPIRPGTEALVAAAIGKLVAEAKGGAVPEAFENVDLNEVLSTAEISLETLEHVAEEIVSAEGAIVIPGGSALGLSNGLQTAEAILTLNALADNLGKAGGVYLSPLSPNEDEYHRPASMQEMAEFVEKMRSGGVKVLFVHGVNPLFELPKSLGFAEALESVEQVISFAVFPDETALAADYIFPDHHGLESWGYQRVATGTAQSALSGAQPVVSPNYDTRSTADVLLAASQALPFADEMQFLQSKFTSLVGQADGFFPASEINTFTAHFQQYGGWWKTSPELVAPSASDALGRSLVVEQAEFEGEGEFYFHPFMSPTLGEAGANKPWLQELPDPTTTVMWNSWVEINPETAHELHIENDDVIKIISEAGEIEVPVYLYPAIRPDTIAMPFGQGHTAYGRYATVRRQGEPFMGLVPSRTRAEEILPRGANPADLLGVHFNGAGDLAFAGMRVRIEKTGRKQLLSRLESRIGVYNEGLEPH